MKSVILALSILTITAVAKADLKIPDEKVAGHTKSETYDGQRALDKYNSLPEQNMTNISGFNGAAQSFRVERSEDGLTQTVCESDYNVRAAALPKVKCTLTKSLDGKVLAPFVFHRRLG